MYPTKLSRRKFFLTVAGAISILDAFPLDKITKRSQWKRIRASTLAGMEEVMGKLPAFSHVPLKILNHASQDQSTYTQIKISYSVEENDNVPAFLLVPKKIKRKAPGMVCLHETNDIGKEEPVGIGGNPNLFYAKELAERGFVCIVPDYPYLGENKFDPYANGYVSCSMKGIVNHKRAIDVLQSLPYVDDSCIGAVGHSLGGHNALFLGCFDERIKAIVTSCGFTTKRHYAQGIGKGNLRAWSGQRYMPRVTTHFDSDPEKVPFDFPEILISLAPRPLFINAPVDDSNFDIEGVKECVHAAAQVYQDVFHKPHRLEYVYPNAQHEFPEAVRIQAYRFLEMWLKS